MAFILTPPRFAPAYQAPQCSPFGFCAPVSRPSYGYRVARPRPQRPQYSSFNHFFNQVDELLSEIDREAQRQAHLEAQRETQREAHRQRQQRKRPLRAKFTVNETEQGWQVGGEFQGFDTENINIEITDEHTLKISGNTEWQAEKKAQPEQAPALQAALTTEPTEQPTESSEDKMDGVTLNEPEYDTVNEAESAAESATVGAATPESDTESHKSYQATVEDDFEDLGAETSSLISSPSRPSSPAEVKEPKGKEKAVETPVSTETTIAQQSQPEAPAQQQQQQPQQLQQEERVHGSFERTFKFPTHIDTENVSASFKDGALEITVPRAQAQQIKRIAIL
ncbi:HSP20-like chaperone [Setomelanomma holmii]|uniref:HSP20-like chaperone n=1 Tax=Setomelanomma holmii TaxID=210430 RepID=A0A9P4H2C5_9PLEO|nr:HSP20-like chaperone [Setomelanomma holmii]